MKWLALKKNKRTPPGFVAEDYFVRVYLSDTISDQSSDFQGNRLVQNGFNCFLLLQDEEVVYCSDGILRHETPPVVQKLMGGAVDLPDLESCKAYFMNRSPAFKRPDFILQKGPLLPYDCYLVNQCGMPVLSKYVDPIGKDIHRLMYAMLFMGAMSFFIPRHGDPMKHKPKPKKAKRSRSNATVFSVADLLEASRSVPEEFLEHSQQSRNYSKRIHGEDERLEEGV